MPYIFVLLLILLIFVIYIYRKPHATKEFSDQCQKVLSDSRVSKDIIPIIEKLVGIVDSRNNRAIGKSHYSLVLLYEETKGAKCYETMREEIDTLFKKTSSLIKKE